MGKVVDLTCDAEMPEPEQLSVGDYYTVKGCYIGTVVSIDGINILEFRGYDLRLVTELIYEKYTREYYRKS